MAAIDGQKRARVLGHAYTLWVWGGSPVAYCTNITHKSPSPLGSPVPVQPLNYVRPAEIAVGRAIGEGTISMTVVELYGHRPWDHLGGSFDGAAINDLADVFHKVQRELTEFGNTPINLIRVIRPPAGAIYVEKYQNVRILDIREDEQVATDSVINQLQMTVAYTHKINSSAGGPGTGAEPAQIPNPAIYE